MSDTKQINVRLPIELHKALADHKVRTGEDKSDVIKRGIELALLGANGHRIITVPPPKEREPKPETIDLAAYLSSALGQPRVLMRQRISAGRVTVGGETFTTERLEKDQLGAEIAVDGTPVKPRKR